jgi:GTP-binding protein EngB required for normal cell division
MKDLPGTSAEYRNFLDRLASDTSVARWVELPMICVMGDTSSGKSSLLSSISTVELPSSHRLTTRCPILLRMKRAEEQLARINIQWKSRKDLPRFTERRITKEEWALIPSTIEEAQQFILTHTQKDVSHDIVTIEVQGPECPADLTLLDLPGLVRSKAHDESESLPEDIQRLVDDYLKNRTRSVILAVHAASNDFHNSQIMAEAIKVDPTTSRTIPVLTKPDLVDPGAEDNVVDLLLGKKISFTMGFHMVKGRGQAALDRKDSIQKGLDDEKRFFDEVEPWRSIKDRSLFGTEQLRYKLSQLQLSMVRESLPGIIREIRQRQQVASATLKEMGNVHSSIYDYRRYYHDLSQKLVSRLKSSLKGRGRSAANTQNSAASMHEACSDFMQSIREGSLSTVRAVVEGAQVLVTTPRGNVCGEVVHLDEEFACVDCVHPADCQSKTLFEYVGVQSKEPIEENDVWSDGSNVYIARKDNLYDSLRKVPLASIRTDPAWLKDKITENRTDELACFLDIDIFKNIVEAFIEEDWRPHCNKLLERTEEITRGAVSDAIKESLTPGRYPLLRALIEKQCRKASRELLVQAQKQVESHLHTEKYPYTQDHVLFENIAEARHRSLRRELEVSMRLDQEGVYDTQAIKAMMDSVFERNKQKSVEDHMAEEMEIVLESYGQVATRRVIDRSPMICWEVFRSLASSIQEALWCVTDVTLMECMEESREFLEKHNALQEELSEMDKALAIFESL